MANSISDINGYTAIHYVLESQTETQHKDNKEKTAIKLAIIQLLLEKMPILLTFKMKMD